MLKIMDPRFHGKGLKYADDGVTPLALRGTAFTPSQLSIVIDPDRPQVQVVFFKCDPTTGDLCGEPDQLKLRGPKDFALVQDEVVALLKKLEGIAVERQAIHLELDETLPTARLPLRVDAVPVASPPVKVLAPVEAAPSATIIPFPEKTT